MSNSSNQPYTPDAGQPSLARKPQETVAPQSTRHGDVNVVFGREAERQREVRSGSVSGTRQGASAGSIAGSGAGSGSELSDAPRDQADGFSFGSDQSQEQMVEQTRLRAYEIYEDRVRKGTQGCCNSDWAQAEHDGSDDLTQARAGRSSERVGSAYANMRANQPRSQD
jgi:hypothetical protein